MADPQSTHNDAAGSLRISLRMQLLGAILGGLAGLLIGWIASLVSHAPLVGSATFILVALGGLAGFRFGPRVVWTLLDALNAVP